MKFSEQRWPRRQALYTGETCQRRARHERIRCNASRGNGLGVVKFQPTAVAISHDTLFIEEVRDCKQSIKCLRYPFLQCQ